MVRILLSVRLGERRLTQAKLAEITGIRPSTINEIYHELSDRINLEHLDLICEALDCDIEDIIVREQNKEPRVKSIVKYTPPRKKVIAISLRHGLHRPCLFFVQP